MNTILTLYTLIWVFLFLMKLIVLVLVWGIKVPYSNFFEKYKMLYQNDMTNLIIWSINIGLLIFSILIYVNL